MRYGFVTMADGTRRKVSRLVLGSSVFGGTTPEDTAFRLMDRFFERGGNAIDTARVYCEWLPGGYGASERTVGRWIRSRGVEKDVFLMTKGAHPKLHDMHTSRLSREDIEGDMALSLEALGLSRVDLYYLHRDDERLPVSGIMETMDGLVRAGQALAIGGSNWRAARLREANEWAAARGKARFTASEVRWSYVDFTGVGGDDTLITMDEGELAAYERMDLAVMAYSSQAGGVFSRGYRADLSDAAPKHAAFVTPENIRRYGALLARCQRESGMTPSRVVLEHVTKHPKLNGFALVGASSLEQLEASLDAMA
ncbi:MAG: aldo/keto reductase [Clostridia bacterium]|nr:aldo/keto reductase [Clostridia bacterium]